MKSEDVRGSGGYITSNRLRRTIAERQRRKEVVHAGVLLCPPGNP